MFYVVAYDYYYPCGGFDDVKFMGCYSDCLEVVEALQSKYDVVSTNPN